MKERKPNRWRLVAVSIGVRRAAVAAVGLALAVGGLGVSAPAASAATSTPSTAAVAKAPALVKPLTSQHSCTAIGNDGKTQAVFCADLVDNGNSSFAPQAEGICQTISTGAIVQCSDISFSFSAWSASFGELEGLSVTCGHSFGPCPAGRYIISDFPVAVSGGCLEVWTVVWAGSTIRLPGSGITKSLSANLGSGHTIVCG